MNVTFSTTGVPPRASSRLLSTTFPYRSSIRTTISVSPPAVTSGSYKRLATLYGAAWSICRTVAFPRVTSRSPHVAVIVTSPATVPGLKVTAAFPSEPLTACSEDMLPYSPFTVKLIATPSNDPLPEVLFLTCTVMVAASVPPAVNHSRSVFIVILSGISAPAGAARRSSPTARYAYIHIFMHSTVCLLLRQNIYRLLMSPAIRKAPFSNPAMIYTRIE